MTHRGYTVLDTIHGTSGLNYFVCTKVRNLRISFTCLCICIPISYTFVYVVGYYCWRFKTLLAFSPITNPYRLTTDQCIPTRPYEETPLIPVWPWISDSVFVSFPSKSFVLDVYVSGTPPLSNHTISLIYVQPHHIYLTSSISSLPLFQIFLCLRSRQNSPL